MVIVRQLFRAGAWSSSFSGQILVRLMNLRMSRSRESQNPIPRINAMTCYHSNQSLFPVNATERLIYCIGFPSYEFFEDFRIEIFSFAKVC